MAGVSNSAFRTICFEFGAGLVYSEMISDKAIHYRSKKTLEMIRMFENEHPLSMQIFGSSNLLWLKPQNILKLIRIVTLLILIWMSCHKDN